MISASLQQRKTRTRRSMLFVPGAWCQCRDGQQLLHLPG